MIRVVCAVVCFLASGVHADTRAELAHLIETSGSYDHSEQRNVVRIEACRLALSVYRPHGNDPFRLFSEFVVDPRGVSFSPEKKTGKPFLTIDDHKGSPVALVIFSISEPFAARHEMALHRNPKPPRRPSPRPGGYVYTTKATFFTFMWGEDSHQKAAVFTQTVRDYTDRYCLTIG